MPSNVQPAVVLCLSGHDPSGGAGIHADIEAVAAQGCHAATVITCLTLQDTLNVQELVPVSTELLKRQVRLISQDYTIAAIKIGLLGSPAMAHTVMELLGELNSRGQPNTSSAGPGTGCWRRRRTGSTRIGNWNPPAAASRHPADTQSAGGETPCRNGGHG